MPIEEQHCNSWEEFLNEVSKNHKDTVYRGLSDSARKLETTLERVGRIKECFYDYYRAILIAKPALESYTNRQWDVSREFDPEKIQPENLCAYGAALPGYQLMLHLRHHGFPSPFLDWTASPFIASFFAFEQTKATHCAVYAFREYDQPDSHEEIPMKTWSPGPVICALGPTIQTHERHYRQQAQYTICINKTSDKPKAVAGDNIVFWSHEEGQCLNAKKYILPTAQKKEVLQKLRQMNITAHTLFGTEDALVESLAADEYMLRS